MIGFWFMFILGVALAVWGYGAARSGKESRFHRLNVIVKRVAFFTAVIAFFAAMINSIADNPSLFISQLDYVAIPALTYLVGYCVGWFIGEN